MLQWLRIDDLVVDTSYQRPIVGRGRINVSRIARDFNWTFFAPVVVSPVEGGKFAIIDGQHRTTAAAVCGFDSVPCQVVIAAQGEQAAAFKAINGVITPITPMALYAAALIAREDWAIEITGICDEADVSLLRYPIATDRQVPGQTMAVGALRACLRRYRHRNLVIALRCITQTDNNKPGMLSARLIKALCESVSSFSDLPGYEERVLEAAKDIDIEHLLSDISSRLSYDEKGPTSSLAEELRKNFARLLSHANSDQHLHVTQRK
ncbi:ParB N-terminal domain-containing protein [Methylobacterium sp. BTF04]|uniref:ParB N-terminal domain-containing protein n=1 Tax=Methylobacterium sp. BTF04 TaxID=2708300 RepID=UPI0013D39518|nr:ParB N-terminal domain-containing protein [Methylobacterium sp. BTF04]NEU14568.1 ParB N-terminal domain-containing protein [Methylobacterium sp. BTF04]